jgi:hypothetical protein
MPTLKSALHTSARIKEVAEAHIFEVVEFLDVYKEPKQTDDESLDIFEVFAAKRKKQEACITKLPEFTVPTAVPARLPETITPPSRDIAPPTTQPTAKTPQAMSAPACSNPQYRYQSEAEDQKLTDQLMTLFINDDLAQTTPAHILTASPII